MISAAKIARNTHAHASHALTRHDRVFFATLHITRTSATQRLTPHARRLIACPVALRAWCLTPAPVTGTPTRSPGISALRPWITARVRASGSTQLLRLVFNSALARGNPAHLCRFALFPRYCMYSVIVQVFSCPGIEAPASPFRPRARGVGRDDPDPLFEKQRPHSH
ncbi:hypothetical protein [Thiolapillus sp.]|uniref:hypothetical protein n=1 Tax=Thiolapillus sp. TaxID=2017437 RepID=UPI003AF77614